MVRARWRDQPLAIVSSEMNRSSASSVEGASLVLCLRHHAEVRCEALYTSLNRRCSSIRGGSRRKMNELAFRAAYFAAASTSRPAGRRADAGTFPLKSSFGGLNLQRVEF